MTQVEFPVEIEGEVRVFRANGEIEIHRSKDIEDEELDEDIKLFLLIKGVQTTFANTPLFLCRNWKIGGK